MLELATKPVLKLRAISTLWQALHENSILYCHCKGNERLASGLQGLTELNVLFAESQKDEIEFILHQLDFKKFNAVSQKPYDDITEFLTLDPDSGKLIHLHAHYRLIPVDPYLKGYQFTSNIESRILEGRVFNEACEVFCIQPAFELVLLFFRESLKLRQRDILLMPLKDNFRNSEYVLREYNWLKARTTDEEICEVVKTCFNNDREIYKIVSGELNGKQLRTLSSLIKSGSLVPRLHSRLNARPYSWYREVSDAFCRKASAILDKTVSYKRINPRGGVVIALVGADGSGKSTITENLKNTFEGKLNVYKIYFGRGKGKASLTRRLLRACKLLFNGGENGKRESASQKTSVKKQGFIPHVYKCIEALLVAQEKKRNLKLMQIAKRKCALVICDRYPQDQIMGYNDGPLLNDFVNSAHFILRALARMERDVYADAGNHPPDILFKLVAQAEVVEKRKPGETSLENLQRKVDGIKRLKFNPPTQVITVDAARPLNEVLTLIRKEIWKVL